MPKKKKELSEEELEELHQKFSLELADKIYKSAESVSRTFDKSYNYDSTVSVFNVLLSISANYAIELGMSIEDFTEVSKDFWQNAKETIHDHGEEMVLDDKSDWLSPKTKNKKELS